MELPPRMIEAHLREELQKAIATTLKTSSPLRCDEKSAMAVAEAYAGLFEPRLSVTELEFDKNTGKISFNLSASVIQFNMELPDDHQ